MRGLCQRDEISLITCPKNLNASGTSLKIANKQLSDPTEIPPPIARHLSHDPCCIVFSVVSQTIAATPPLLSVTMAYRNPKTGLGRRVSQL